MFNTPAQTAFTSDIEKAARMTAAERKAKRNEILAFVKGLNNPHPDHVKAALELASVYA